LVTPGGTGGRRVGMSGESDWRTSRADGQAPPSVPPYYLV